MQFTASNINPLKKKTGDCAVRSIASGTGKTWNEVYQGLFEIGFKNKTMPNSKETMELYLDACGWTRHKMPRKTDKTKYTVRELADERKETMIVQVANHFTAIVNGELIDTWNCSQKSVYNFYTKR